MTRYEFIGRVMSIGANNTNKNPDQKIKAKDEAVNLLDQFLSDQWIDVNDELPPENELVWVCGTMDHEDDWRQRSGVRYEYSNRVVPIGASWKVLYWMKPAPPIVKK